MARTSKRSADASETAAKAAQGSAEAAKSAAEATERSAVAAIASLKVSFQADPAFLPVGPAQTLLYRMKLTNTGTAAVTVHDLRLDPVLIGVQDFDEGRLEVNLNTDGSVTRTGLLHADRTYFFHQGEEISLELDPLELSPSQSCEGYAAITYSLDGRKDSSRTCIAPFEFVRSRRP